MFWRFRYRTMFFVSLIGLLILGRFFAGLSIYPVAVSPFVSLTVAWGKIATIASDPANFLWNSNRIEAISIIGIACALIVLCLLKRRPLCHTVCPVGYCFDVSGKAKRKCFGSNRSPLFLRRVPPLGLLFIVLTVLGVGFGSLTFLWLDPFVLFSSLFRQNIGNIALPACLFVILIVSSFFLPTFWCYRLCPLGATQDVLYWPKRFFQTFQESEASKQGKSPENALNADIPERRRRLLLFGVFVCATGIVFNLCRRLSLASHRIQTIRPPGSLPEPFFTALCSRCGNCIQACPTGLLKPIQSGLRIATPKADFTPDDPTWCNEHCRSCSEVCPTGAIRPFEIKDKKDLPFAQAVFVFEYCRLYDDVECSVCSRECPYEAVSYQWSEEEYRRMVVIDNEKCTGCGWCLATCPVVRECGTEKVGSPLEIIARSDGIEYIEQKCR